MGREIRSFGEVVYATSTGPSGCSWEDPTFGSSGAVEWAFSVRQRLRASERRGSEPSSFVIRTYTNGVLYIGFASVLAYLS